MKYLILHILFGLISFSAAYSQCEVSDLIETLGGPLEDQGHSVCFDTENEVYFVGEIRQSSPANGWDWVVQKRDVNFMLVWEYSYGTVADEMGDNFLVHPDGLGGCLLAGFEHSTFRRMILARVDHDGDLVWSQHMNTNTVNGETPACFALGENSDVMLVGTTNTYGAGGSDAFILNLDLNNGGINWSKSLGLPGNQHLYTVKALPDGNFVASGTAAYAGSNGRDPWLLKFSSLGEILNEYALPAAGSGNAWIMDMVIDPEGAIYATGHFSVSGQGGARVYIAELNFELDVIWSSINPQNTMWYGSSIVLSPNQELFVLAASQEKSRLIKVDQITGNFEWVKEFATGDNQYSSIYGQNLVFLSDQRLFWTGWIGSDADSNQIVRYYANGCDEEDCFSALAISATAGPTNRISILSDENSLGSFQNYSLVRSEVADLEINLACGAACVLQGELEVPTHCLGESISQFLVFDNSVGNTSFHWALNGETVSTSEDFILDGSLLPGSYVMEIVLTQSDVCSLVLSDVFEVLAPPQLKQLDDVVECADSLMLSSIYSGDWYFQGAPVEYAFDSGQYEYAVSNSCGTAQEVINITFLESEVSIVASDTLDCYTPEVILAVDPLVEDSAFIEWLDLNSGDFMGNGQQLPVSSMGHYGVSVLLPNGCVAQSDYIVEFNQNNPEVYLNIQDTLDCLTPFVQLGLNEVLSNVSTIVWYHDNVEIIEAVNSFTINADSPGVYEVEVVFTGGCVSTSFAEVMSIEDSIEVIIPADTLDCSNQAVELQPIPYDQDMLFQWTFNNTVIANSVNATVSDAGLYTLMVTDPSSGCFGTGTAVVYSNVVFPTFQILINGDSLSCDNPILNVTSLSMDGISYDYVWYNLSEELLGTGSMQDFQEQGTYFIVATNPDNGCITEESFEIFQVDETLLLNGDILFPNIITVNDDSKNEQWKPFHRSMVDFVLHGRLDVYEAKVYNRWGTLLFEGGISDGESDYWSPRDLSDGVYYYIVRFSTDCDSNVEVREGYIHVVR